jgi:hypothetical protein
MALTDWNFGTHGPEILVDMGTVGIQKTLGVTTLSADFGDGFFAQVVTGNTKGLRKWHLVWSERRHLFFQSPPTVIPMFDDGTYAEDLYLGTPVVATKQPNGDLTYNIPDDGKQPRLTYITRFYQRRLRDGLPFVFCDITERTTYNADDPYNLGLGGAKYLARITSANIPATQSAKSAHFWSWSLDIQQVRPGYDASQD